MAFFALSAGFFSSVGTDFAARAATTERVVVNHYSGFAIEGLIPSPISPIWPSRARGRGRRVRRGLAFPQRGQRASFVAHPEIYGPSSAVMILSISDAA
jgi:hypothetical protein